MTSPRQRDLFHDDEQAELPDDAPTPVFRPDPDQVRTQLQRILAEARAAKTLPWDSRKVALYQTVFPQMSQCLPADEGALLRFEFETELRRLRGRVEENYPPPLHCAPPASHVGNVIRVVIAVCSRK